MEYFGGADLAPPFVTLLAVGTFARSNSFFFFLGLGLTVASAMEWRKEAGADWNASFPSGPRSIHGVMRGMAEEEEEGTDGSGIRVSEGAWDGGEEEDERQMKVRRR